MNSWKQTLCVTAAFVLLVGGLTFAWNFLGVANSDDPTTQAAKAADKSVKLRFFTTQNLLPGQFEVNSVGWADFCFENDKAEPMAVRIDYQNCQCNKVEMTLLSEAEITKLPSWPLTVTDSSQEPAFLVKSPGRWQELDKNGSPLTVPANSKGLLRVSWTGRKIGPHQAVVTLVTQKPSDDSTRAITRLDAGAMYVPPILTDVSSDGLKLPDLEPDGLVTAEFNCWSPNRTKFQLEVKDKAGDPHFEFSVRPLSDRELKLTKFQLISKGHRDPQLKSGYRVSVTARELVGGKHLDIGVFERTISLLTDVSPNRTIALKGQVRGQVEVGSQEHQGVVFLARFPAERGITVNVPINSTLSNLNLKLLKEQIQPSYLQVSLHGPEMVGTDRHWQLTVTVPPHIPAGRLPEGSEVVLQMVGPQPRLIRIPVHGAAYE